MEMGEDGDYILWLHCYHQNDSCIKMGSDKSHVHLSLIVKDKVTRQCPQPKRIRTEIPTYQTNALPLSPFLTERMSVRPNILRTLRRTMIRFLIEHLVRRIWFGQSKLYFILNWLVMRCKLRLELAADAQQTA